MKKVLFYGNFGSPDQTISDGQTSKTTNFFKYSQSYFKDVVFECFNTKDFKKRPLKNFFGLKKSIKNADIIVIFPGSINSLNVFRIAFRHTKNKDVFYPVVGGWLADRVANNQKIINFLKRIKKIYPETKGLKNKLERLGINNTSISPTFSLREPIPFASVRNSFLENSDDNTFRMVYFGRITKTKGIYLAIEAINKLNKGKQLYTLDFYGKLAEGENFDSFFSQTNSNIKYKGVLDDKDVWSLCKYDYFLFPTFYPGEGFPACCVESLLYGTPIIASDWKYNKEIINENADGFIFNLEQNNLSEILHIATKSKNFVLERKYNAYISGQNYLPDKAIQPFIKDLEEVIHG